MNNKTTEKTNEQKILKQLSADYQTLIEEVEDENDETGENESVIDEANNTNIESSRAAAEPSEIQGPYEITFEAERSRLADETEISLEGLKDFYKMRRGWSALLMISLLIIITFNIVIVVLVGNGILAFKDEWFLRLVLTTNLGEIIGLIWLVVKFLFQHPPVGSPSVKE